MTDNRIVLFEPNAAIVAALKAACPSDTDIVTDWPQAIVDRGTTVIVGPSIDLPSILRFANEFVSRDRGCSIIVVRSRVDTTLLTTAIRAGISDVVVDNDLVELGSAIARTRRRNTHRDTALTRSHVTTVCAAKGGVGKTTVAVTTALALTARGHRTALVDLDLEFGDVTTTLNIKPVGTIADIDRALSADHVDTETVMALLTQHPSGLHVLAAPLEPSAAFGLTVDIVGHVIDALTREFDHVVIDTPPSLNEHVLAAIDRSQTVAVLTTLDVPALRNACTAIRTLQSIGVAQQRLHLIVNRADAETGVALNEASQVLNLPVTIAIPSSRDVPASVNAGTFLAHSSPNHPVCVAVATFADVVAGSMPSEIAPDTTPVRRLVKVRSTSRWSRLMATRGSR